VETVIFELFRTFFTNYVIKQDMLQQCLGNIHVTSVWRGECKRV